MKGFTEFLLLSPSLAGYSLNGYMDKDGNVKKIIIRKDEHGNDIARRFAFSYNSRVIRIPNAQTEIIKFLREAPECVDSPNAAVDHSGKSVQKFYYKEVNTDKDNEAVVENETRRIQAQSAALALKGADLAQIATLCGCLAPEEATQRKKVLDYSGSNPVGFMEMLKSPDVKSKALLRNAVAALVIKKKGFIYMWEDVHLGNDEDQAVQTLMKDKKVFDSIERAMSKIEK